MAILCPLAVSWWVFIAAFCVLHAGYYSVDRLPRFVKHLFVYGKVRDKKKARGESVWDTLLSVPKGCFWHFYALSFIWNSSLLGLVVYAWFLGGTFPQKLIGLLMYLTYYPDEPSSHLSIILAMILIVVQATRRTYECFFVSSYSNSKIHLIHYVMGLYFYLSLGLSVLSKAPNLNRGTFIQLNDIGINHVLGITLFIWATIHHHRAHIIFANLRKGKHDKSHKIPHGDWFEYVSCPHYLAEILIYLSIQIILGFDHTLFLAVFIFTLANQTAASKFVHRWYRDTFPDYPKDRMAVFPWVL